MVRCGSSPKWLSLALLVCVSGARASTVYAINDLGSLGGSSAAMALNDSGLAVGYSTSAHGDVNAASFGDHAASSLGFEGQAAGVNNSSVIAGTSWSSGQAQAVTWSNGHTTSLAGLGGTGSYASSINASGQVAGSAMRSSGAAHATVWSNGNVADLGTLGGDWSAAMAINSFGRTAGTSQMADGAFEAFFSTGSGSMLAIGTLGGRSSYGMGINDAGEVVGNAQTAAGYSHAFSWTESGLRDLGTLGGTQSYAYGVDNSGAVVGYSYTSSGASHGFVYRDGVLLDLNSLLPISSDWTISEAFAINDSGVIAGIGVSNGVEHAIELLPQLSGSGLNSPLQASATPEPGMSSLVCLGTVLVGLFSYLTRLSRLRAEG